MTSTSAPGTRGHSDWILTLACDSARGQVVAVCNVLDGHLAYLRSVATHDDARTGRFFIRIDFRLPQATYHDAEQHGRLLHAKLTSLTRPFGAATLRLHRADERPKVLLMVSRRDHCLLQLLDGWHTGELAMDPVAIVSNHPDLQALATAEGLPFHHLPVTPQTRDEQALRLRTLVSDVGAEFIVLARYRQVLSDAFVTPLFGRIVNIHHSFLPSFQGAHPYEQAWERGVKLIGATAHFVTPDLDDGPIIEQAVEPVTHADTPERLVQIGRHVEGKVLRRALQQVLERRVFLNGTRTVVFV
jgi:formyltetrahydrofolate deformylase